MKSKREKRNLKEIVGGFFCIVYGLVMYMLIPGPVILFRSFAIGYGVILIGKNTRKGPVLGYLLTKRYPWIRSQVEYIEVAREHVLRKGKFLLVRYKQLVRKKS